MFELHRESAEINMESIVLSSGYENDAKIAEENDADRPFITFQCLLLCKQLKTVLKTHGIHATTL